MSKSVGIAEEGRGGVLGEGGVEGVHEVIEDGSALLGAGGQDGPDAFAPGASGRAAGARTIPIIVLEPER